MEKEPILPRPSVLSEPLLKKWLSPEELERFRGAWNVQSGKRLLLEAVEDAIRARYPNGIYPPTEELLSVARETTDPN